MFHNQMDWNKWLNNHKHKIREDGKVDIYQDVSLYKMNLKKLPFKFGNVGGYFDCSNNKLNH